jgi:NADH-quinone oxidoreductase subunit G
MPAGRRLKTMSDKPDNQVTIEVDGVPLEARPGQMLIEVTDRAGIYVPRFCYHKKLSIAANCRMCLVDVEKAPKPLPACATPVADGMKVATRSLRAVSAQKATMEFLLINHPLDCPICDQGGECELQDLAMGFGRGVSRYTEKKRVVKDKNLGPLVSTDMTRCIHCTRCVRFGQEIAGIQELGTIGRSEHMQISTYIEKSVDHELSGNIIDVCPVGALNNKPFRFGARAWEMVARPLVAPHDCAGSNLYGHVLRGRLRRVVPGDNEAINETWISDRDRFSCHGLYGDDRLTKPMIRRDQDWLEVSWQEALEFATESVRAAVAHEGESLGVLASPSATIEELYLLRRIAAHLGSRNVDHRLRRLDFRDQENDPPWPWLGCSIADLETRDGILLVGSNIRMEVPIFAHRIRKAALQGAAVGFVSPEDYEVHFPRAANLVAPVTGLVAALAGVLVAAAKAASKPLPRSLASDLESVEPSDEHASAAEVLLGKTRALVLIGQIAARHPQFAELRALAAALADITGAQLGYLPEGGNGVGAALAGFVPHRDVGGVPATETGFDAHRMLASPRHAYVLFGVEPDKDLAEGELAGDALKSADVVVAFAPFASESLLDCADVLLPVATFAETDGTFVNAEGRWQTFAAAADPPGDTRPGWRVLRVLGNAFGLADCEYRSAADVRAALEAELTRRDPDNGYAGVVDVHLDGTPCELDALDVPIYSVDGVVRRSEPLQETRAARLRNPRAPVAEAASA